LSKIWRGRLGVDTTHVEAEGVLVDLMLDGEVECDRDELYGTFVLVEN